MKHIRALISLLAISNAVYASIGTFYKGMNVRHYNSTGGFKTPGQYFETFRRISRLPGNFTAVRVYSTEEGAYRPLKTLVDASQAHGLDLLLGLYLDDGRAKDAKTNIEGGRFAVEFDQLKQGLEYADSIGAIDNVIGISVGNEDLYQGTQTPEAIAAMIQKVQTYLKIRFPNVPCIPVGHTDTYTMVANENNSAVAEVADFLAANAFPFWENIQVEEAAHQFNQSMALMDKTSQKYNIPVFLGETGWPTDGQFQSVSGSVAGLQQYWNEVFCSTTFRSRNAFYYMDDDNGFVPQQGGPHWGILDEQGQPKIDLECP